MYNSTIWEIMSTHRILPFKWLISIVSPKNIYPNKNQLKITSCQFKMVFGSKSKTMKNHSLLKWRKKTKTSNKYWNQWKFEYIFNCHREWLLFLFLSSNNIRFFMKKTLICHAQWIFPIEICIYLSISHIRLEWNYIGEENSIDR